MKDHSKNIGKSTWSWVVIFSISIVVLVVFYQLSLNKKTPIVKEKIEESSPQKAVRMILLYGDDQGELERRVSGMIKASQDEHTKIFAIILAISYIFGFIYLQGKWKKALIGFIIIIFYGYSLFMYSKIKERIILERTYFQDPFPIKLPL